jgi:hypothetical protein
MKPRQAFTKPTGPYVLFGIHGVPDEILPLSPLAITHELTNEINAHAGQASDDAATAKRLLAYDSSIAGLKGKVAAAKHGTTLGIPGLAAGAAQQFEFGGTMPATIEYLTMLRERLDRQSGMNDIIRGNVTGVTATESQIADTRADVRTRMARTQFQRSVVECLSIAAWLMHESDQVQFYVPVTDPQTGQETPALFVGGPSVDPMTGEQIHIPFEHLKLEIEPYSMEMVDEALLQRRMLQVGTLVTQWIEIIPQTPFIRWTNLMDDLLQTVNIREGSKRYIDWDMVAQVQGMAAAAAGAEMAALEGGGAGDAGAAQAAAGQEAEEAAYLEQVLAAA